MRRVFITTSIPYVNSTPHLGFSLEIVQADALARYYRCVGYDVFFLTGVDENAIKNAQKAREKGRDVQEFVDENAQAFYRLKKTLNLSFDKFIRTTSDEHKRAVHEFWRRCRKDIYKSKYKGLYCVGCEAFYKKGEFPEDICPDHKRKLEYIQEENYFFALSRYEKKLLELFEKNKIIVLPEFRKKEVLNFIDQGLEDFSISRSKKRAYGWGIDVPDDPSQKIYVWFDALINYLSGLGFPDSKNFSTYWAENKNKIHLIGKDIVKFHLIYWPAMLMSAGLDLPDKVFVHGHISVEGRKMSKSLGNVVSPFDLVEKYGQDAVRYYLLREIPSGSDGDFSEQRFKDIYSAELADQLGNLILRILSMAARENIEMPEPKQLDFPEVAGQDFCQLMEGFRINQAIELVLARIKHLNKSIDEFQPWQRSGEEKRSFLRKMLQDLFDLGRILEIFMPETGEKIKKYTTGKIKKHPPLFAKIF